MQETQDDPRTTWWLPTGEGSALLVLASSSWEVTFLPGEYPHLHGAFELHACTTEGLGTEGI